MINRSFSNLAETLKRKLRSSELPLKVQHRARLSLPNLDYERLFADLGNEAVEDAKTGTFPFLFSVVSWGCAATEWLATTLNSHPDVLCWHCVNMSWSKFGGARSLDGWKYLRVIGISGSSYRACGDVHGVSRDAIPELREKLGARFNCAVVVREPMPRLRSQIALFETSPVKTGWNVDYVQKFIDHGVRLPEDNLDNRLFLHGVNMLNSIIQEEPIAPIWRSEDLTTDAATLGRFVEELTKGYVEVELEWAQRAVRRPPSNVHRRPSGKPRLFEPWQLDAIKKVVEPRAWQI